MGMYRKKAAAFRVVLKTVNIWNMLWAA